MLSLLWTAVYTDLILTRMSLYEVVHMSIFIVLMENETDQLPHSTEIKDDSSETRIPVLPISEPLLDESKLSHEEKLHNSPLSTLPAPIL